MGFVMILSDTVWNPEVAAEANFFDPRLKVTLGQKKRIRPYDGTG